MEEKGVKRPKIRKLPSGHDSIGAENSPSENERKSTKAREGSGTCLVDPLELSGKWSVLAVERNRRVLAEDAVDGGRLFFSFVRTTSMESVEFMSGKMKICILSYYVIRSRARSLGCGGPGSGCARADACAGGSCSGEGLLVARWSSEPRKRDGERTCRSKSRNS